jgi:hypothetical protein
LRRLPPPRRHALSPFRLRFRFRHATPPRRLRRCAAAEFSPCFFMLFFLRLRFAHFERHATFAIYFAAFFDDFLDAVTPMPMLIFFEGY